MRLRQRFTLGLLALLGGLSTGVLANDPCSQCYNTFVECKYNNPGFEDYCEIRYTLCQRRNGCETGF